ncbi:hypothetical protein B0T25DRAFT_420808, partial [Lasiosphaeria hispida]
SPLGLFRLIVHQALKQAPSVFYDLIGTFRQRCEEMGKPGEAWQWHQKELWRLLEVLLPQILKDHPVWLFVNALDECGEENAIRVVRGFKFLLGSLHTSSSHADLKGFHVCFSCRHFPILALNVKFEVCLKDENQNDISAFVLNQLAGFQKTIVSALPSTIAYRAYGSFTWARVMVERVFELECEGKVTEYIEGKALSLKTESEDSTFHPLLQ